MEKDKELELAESLSSLSHNRDFAVVSGWIKDKLEQNILMLINAPDDKVKIFQGKCQELMAIKKEISDCQAKVKRLRSS